MLLLPWYILKSMHDSLSSYHRDLGPQYINHANHHPGSISAPFPPSGSLLNMQFNLVNLLFIKKKKPTSMTSQEEVQKLCWPVRPCITSLCPTTPHAINFILRTHTLFTPATLDSLTFEYAVLRSVSQALPSVWNADPFTSLPNSYLFFKSKLNHSFSRKTSLTPSLGA